MQADGKICAFVDAENTYDKEWATRLGVDNDSLILIRRRSAGAIGDQLAPLIKANIDFIAIDSITAIMPENFVDDDGNLKEFDKRKQIGANSRALGILYNGFLYDIDRTAIALISQQRADLSGQHAMMRPSGGKATEFASSIILKLNSSNSESQQKMGRVYLGDKVHQFPVGREVKVYGEKNKIGPQSRTGSYLFYYSGDKVGIDHVDEAVTLGKMFGIVDSAGAWTRFGSEPYVTGINQWQGQPAFVNALNEDPELYAKLEKQLNEVML
jgi:recombination protein RecA